METAENTLKMFNWKLEKTTISNTIFNKKKMIEYSNIKLIYGFLATNMGISYVGNPKYKNNVAYGVNTEQEQMENYKKMYSKSLKGFQLGYILPKHKYGRIIPANYTSLSVFRRQTRHRLARDYYVDIDMINAQPTIIYEICKLNNIEKKSLGKYIKDPKKWRKAVMEHHNCDNDIAKNLFICMMFGGSYDSWLKENDIQENKLKKIKAVCDMEDELKSVMDIVYATNQTIKEDVLRLEPNKWKTEIDAKRSVMALWTQTIERLLQETAIKWLCDNKGFELEKIVPCQDGFMILKDLWYDEILEDVSNAIKESYSINIQFLNKPFDQAIEIPEYEEEKTVDEWIDNLSFKKLADKFLEIFGNYIIKYKSSVYVYWVDESGGRWYDETNSKKQHKLALYISEKLYDHMKTLINDAVEIDSKDRSSMLKTLRSHTSKSYCINDIIKHILSKCTEAETDFNNNPFLLGFNNGVYELDTGIFRQYKFDDYITLSTGYDYKPESILTNNELKITIDNIFNEIQPNETHRNLFLQMLASGLDGRLYQKLFLLNGTGGNGKGLVASLMKEILGGYACQPTNGILKDVEKSNSPSPDLYMLKGKRYVNFTEVGGLIRVAMLRNLTGGTTFTARLLGENPEQFKLNATFVMEFNNAPELDGKPQQADYRRLVDLYFPMCYTDDPNKIGKEIAGVKYAEANPYYETEEFIKSVKYYFLHKLLKVYKDNYVKDVGIKFVIPDDIRKRTEQFIENQNLFQKVFNDLYVKVDIIPNDKSDLKLKTIKIRQVWEDIVSAQEYKALTYREKRQYGRDEFYKWIETTGLKTINVNRTLCIIGIQKRDNINDDDADDLSNPLDNGVIEI